MTDPATRICDELGVCRGEALFYLEGFKWNLESAMEACRSKTLPLPLPPVTVESSPRVSAKEKSASESPSTPPIAIVSRRSSYQPPYPAEEQPPQTENELIKKFYEVAKGSSVDEARQFLQCSNWSLGEALSRFFDERRPTQGDSSDDDDDTKLGQWMSQRPRIPIKINFPRRAVEVDSTNSPNEAGGQHNPQARPPMASSSQVQDFQQSTSPAKIREENLWPPMDVWIDRICDAAGVCREEALFYLEGYKWKFDVAMEACRSKTLPPDEESAESSPEKPSRVYNEKLINSFVEAVGATKQQAIDYLEACNWNVDQAVNSFLEGFSAHETSMALQMSMMEFGDPPLASMGLPSQSQSSGFIGSSSSSINADPTETQRSVQDVTVADPGIASSQAAEEDSNRETFSDPFARTIVGPRNSLTFITLTIILADVGSGTSLDIPFRSDQTVGDIRTAIAERTQLKDRDYYLQSMLGDEYRDLNVTVDRISADGTTTLIQMLTDP